MKLFDLVENHCSTYDTTIEFLRDKRILRRDIPKCPLSNCEREMRAVRCGNGDTLLWRCPKHKGRKISLKDGSFLEKSKISYKDFILLTYLWACETQLKTCITMMDISEPCIIQWFNYLREVCSARLINNPLKFGGPGIVVQVCELAIAKRKYNRSHYVQERWIFGIYDTTTKLGYLEFVSDRSADTLLPRIRQRIKPGSTIQSGNWEAYDRISQIDVNPAYLHQKVDHGRNFVDPNTQTHTNYVECMWKNANSKFKCMHGVHLSMASSYVDEFMWRTQYGTTHNDAFNNILDDIAEMYPTP